MGKHESTPKDRAMKLMDGAGYRQIWVRGLPGSMVTACHPVRDFETLLMLVEWGGRMGWNYHEYGRTYSHTASGAGWQSLEDWLRAQID